MTPALAILVALVSALFFALTDLSLRKGLRHTTPDMGAIVSVAAQWVAYTLIIGAAGMFSDLTSLGFRWFFLTGILNPGLFLIFFVIGIQRIGVARSASIKGSGPIFAGILAFFLLGERLEALQYVGIAMAVGGIILISAEGLSRRAEAAGAPAPSAAVAAANPYPMAAPPRKLDFLFPLLAGIAGGSGSVLYKLALGKMPSPLLGAWVTTTTGLLMYPLLSFCFPPGNRFGIRRPGIPWLILSGLTAAAAVYGMVSAIQLGQVSIVFTLIQTSPLMVLLLSVFFLRRLERITLKLVLGACLTVGGGVLVGLF
ncbi:MAG: DMT family transporter [Candidatus Tectomicrobia bacterium]|nr:DMT family transporter [Candidatus Tectomicrobia bacterium]